MRKILDENSSIQEIMEHPIGRDWMRALFYHAPVPRWFLKSKFFGKKSLKDGMKWVLPGLDESIRKQAVEILNENTDIELRNEGEIRQAWWKDAVFYQIYPASFNDSDDDGLGDLNGIMRRLEYIRSLGVDGLILAPIMQAENRDFGYDITNHRAVMPEMGSMDDLEALIERVHQLGMKIILSMPINHTSDHHPWFQEALRDPDGPYGQYYILRRGKEGSPPNNWTSRFDGRSAWRWFPEEELYALHLFSDYQMDLNWSCPRLRREMYDAMRFWLEKGADGLFITDNAFIAKREGLPDGLSGMQEFSRKIGWENYMLAPELHTYHREIRREVFEPYGACFIGEVPLVGRALKTLLSSQNRGELDLYLDYEHLDNPYRRRYDESVFDLKIFKEFFTEVHQVSSDYEWHTVFFENHDLSRMVSMVDPTHFWRERLSKYFLILLLSMKGTPLVYQGQELGEANQPFHSIEELKDIASLGLYERLKEEYGEQFAWNIVLAGTRDHARMPMHWNSGFNGGFTQGTPYLKRPIPDYGWDAASQEREPFSVLSAFRRLSSIRHAYPALVRGSIRFICPKHKRYFAYLREYGEEKILCEFNLTAYAFRKPWEASGFKRKQLLFSNLERDLSEGRRKNYPRQMVPFEASITLLEKSP